MIDIEKLKAEFKKLEYVSEKLEHLSFDEHLGCYVEKNNGMPVGLAAWVNGAFYGFKQAKAQLNALEESRMTWREYAMKIESGEYELVKKDEAEQAKAQSLSEELRRFCNEHKDPAWRGRLTEYDKGYSDCCIAVLEMIEAQDQAK